LSELLTYLLAGGALEADFYQLDKAAEPALRVVVGKVVIDKLRIIRHLEANVALCYLLFVI